MGLYDRGKCCVFCGVSFLAFLMISVSSSNFVFYLSNFYFAFLNLNDNINGVNESYRYKSDNMYLCRPPRLGKESRFWCSVMVLTWDLILLLIFCAQHRIMARTPFKKFLAQTFEDAYILDRPLYLIATSLSLNMGYAATPPEREKGAEKEGFVLLMSTWQPLDTYIWYIDPINWKIPIVLIYITHICAWLIIFVEILLMDLFEFVGLKQMLYYCTEMEHPLLYKTVACQRLYRRMRHPGLVCMLVILWLYPVMSLDRYLLVSVFTVFLLYGHRVQVEDYVYVVEMHKKKVRTFHSAFHSSPHEK